MTDFRAFFHIVRLRRRMYLPDDRYATLVAFVLGYDAATEGQLLRGFNDWVAGEIVGHPTSLHWSALVAARQHPEIMNGVLSIADLRAEADEPAMTELFDLLDRFLGLNQNGGR